MRDEIVVRTLRTLLAVSATAALFVWPHATFAADAQTLHGTILSLPSYGKLELADERGYVDDVTLRDDTALYPRDLQLVSGLTVVIIGHTSGHTFDADEIDLQNDGAQAPLPAYATPADGTPGYTYDAGSTAIIEAQPTIVTTYGLGVDPFYGYYGGYGTGYFGGGYPAYGASIGAPPSSNPVRSTQPVYRRSGVAGYASGSVHPAYAPRYRAAPSATRTVSVPTRASTPARR
jgi:hypothetical protein